MRTRLDEIVEEEIARVDTGGSMTSAAARILHEAYRHATARIAERVFRHGVARHVMNPVCASDAAFVHPALAEEKVVTAHDWSCKHNDRRKGERRKGTEQRSYLDTSLNDEPRELWRPDKTWAWRSTYRSGKDRRKL